MKKTISVIKILFFMLFVVATYSSASLNARSVDGITTRVTNLDAVRVMLAALKSTDPYVRVDAAQTLGELGNPKAIDALIRTLKDENFYVRAYTAEALGKLHNNRAVEPLLEALEDKDFFVRAHVVKALGDLKDPGTVEPLLALLQGSDDAIKPYAAWALGEINDASMIRPLIEALNDIVCCDAAAAALTKMTTHDFGANYEEWNAWWLKTH